MKKIVNIESKSNHFESIIHRLLWHEIKIDDISISFRYMFSI